MHCGFCQQRISLARVVQTDSCDTTAKWGNLQSDSASSVDFGLSSHFGLTPYPDSRSKSSGNFVPSFTVRFSSERGRQVRGQQTRNQSRFAHGGRRLAWTIATVAVPCGMCLAASDPHHIQDEGLSVPTGCVQRAELRRPNRNRARPDVNSWWKACHRFSSSVLKAVYCCKGTSLVQNSGAHFARKLTETVQCCESSEVLTFRGRVEPASRENLRSVLSWPLAIWAFAACVPTVQSLCRLIAALVA